LVAACRAAPWRLCVEKSSLSVKSPDSESGWFISFGCGWPRYAPFQLFCPTPESIRMRQNVTQELRDFVVPGSFHRSRPLRSTCFNRKTDGQKEPQSRPIKPRAIVINRNPAKNPSECWSVGVMGGCSNPATHHSSFRSRPFRPQPIRNPQSAIGPIRNPQFPIPPLTLSARPHKVTRLSAELN
jgi:hypothetical protein